MTSKIYQFFHLQSRYVAMVNYRAFSLSSSCFSRRKSQKRPKVPATRILYHKEVADEHKQALLTEKLMVDEINLEDLAELKKIQSKAEDEDMPVPGLLNPYIPPPPRCILCDHDVELDYKNVRLLSQFVSSHTGQIYGRATTGLCLYMQKRVSKLIQRARFFGFMPYRMKDPHFLKDPKLFDPYKGPYAKPQRS